jgi:hypothetical protein
MSRKMQKISTNFKKTKNKNKNKKKKSKIHDKITHKRHSETVRRRAARSHGRGREEKINGRQTQNIHTAMKKGGGGGDT